MSVGRREFLAGALGSGAVFVLPGRSWAGVAGQDPTVFIVRDSRLGEHKSTVSRRQSLDLASIDDAGWLRLAAERFDGIDSVVGETAWQDFVVLRDLFRDRGFRLAGPERRIELPAKRCAFSWSLERRT